jgi:hypothetical protein
MRGDQKSNSLRTGVDFSRTTNSCATFLAMDILKPMSVIACYAKDNHSQRENATHQRTDRYWPVLSEEREGSAFHHGEECIRYDY